MGVTIFRPGQRLVIPSPSVQVWSPGVASAAASAILDGISNVAAAYSLRKLRSAYVGSAVRVRRSSDSTEQDIGFDGTGEFDSATYSAFVGGGTGFVRTWYDQSGNGRDAGQAAAGNQPQIALSALNGKPSLSFNGNNGMITASFTTVNQSFTWLHVSRQNNTSNLVPFSNGDAVAVFWFNGTGAFYAGTTLMKSATVTNANIFSAIANGASSSVFVNGGTPTTGDAGTNGFARIEVGDWKAIGSSFPFAGNVADFVALSAIISTTDHNTIGANMATRYGLSWTTVT